MAPNKGFTPDQVARYARHLILPEVGGAGQRKLLASSVLLLGAGGLGSPAGMYLAAAGVGKIGVVDFDRVRGCRASGLWPNGDSSPTNSEHLLNPI